MTILTFGDLGLHVVLIIVEFEKEKEY